MVIWVGVGVGLGKSVMHNMHNHSYQQQLLSRIMYNG